MIVDATFDLTSEIISQFGQALNDDDAIQFKRGDFIITETTKANLVNDILIRGLDKYLSEIVKLPVYVGEEPLLCVAKGTGKALEEIDILQQLSYE